MGSPHFRSLWSLLDKKVSAKTENLTDSVGQRAMSQQTWKNSWRFKLALSLSHPQPRDPSTEGWKSVSLLGL